MSSRSKLEVIMDGNAGYSKFFKRHNLELVSKKKINVKSSIVAIWFVNKMNHSTIARKTFLSES